MTLPKTTVARSVSLPIDFGDPSALPCPGPLDLSPQGKQVTDSSVSQRAMAAPSD